MLVGLWSWPTGKVTATEPLLKKFISPVWVFFFVCFFCCFFLRIFFFFFFCFNKSKSLQGWCPKYIVASLKRPAEVQKTEWSLKEREREYLVSGFSLGKNANQRKAEAELKRQLFRHWMKSGIAPRYRRMILNFKPCKATLNEHTVRDNRKWQFSNLSSVK